MADTPKTELSQEIRFAVVMYGGSSLAIYMNGVAQELLHLVRATAEKPDSAEDNIGELYRPEVSGSERVYRELGQMLVRGKMPRLDVEAGDSVRTRFVIDIISGTSAGGINGVFLAKALANDQELDRLRDLWIDFADFNNLLNDSKGEGIPQKPPKALVNSPLMYQKIHGALQAMENDKPRDAAWRSPYAEQLDLFTTFTDIQGQTISLKLADVVAIERKHLGNFRFTYNADGTTAPENDFLGANDPFLAFAARSTSAHPAAFEPVILDDIAKDKCDPTTVGWRKFYEEYLQEAMDAAQRKKLAESFQSRPLADGGTLDNSPFSFAIDQFQSRHVRRPVDRKLIYLEPSPEAMPAQPDDNKKPNAISNALLALSSLPSYQFIRDDIRRIMDRNLLIQRVNRILMGVEEDRRLPVISGAEFRRKSFEEMVAAMGSAWGGYHRLRVGETTDELALTITRAAGYNTDSDESLAILYLVRAWRGLHYTTQASEKRTENEFLYTFDLLRQIRRLKFVLRKGSEISCFDERSAKIVEVASDKAAGDDWREMKEDSQFRKDFRKDLFEAIRQLNSGLRTLYATHTALTSARRPDEETRHPLSQAVSGLGITRKALHDILLEPSEGTRLAKAERMIRSTEGPFQVVVDAAIDQFKVMHEVAAHVKTAVLPQNGNLAQRTLRYYYDNFTQYDMVAHPILYSTDAGEELDTVEVFRVSPGDVKLPINKADKLAGLSLGHFGALMDSRYRINDILWGRLDCAERLITLLLRSAPPPNNEADAAALEKKRKELIREAQEAIVIEEIAFLDEDLKKELGFDSGPPRSGHASLRTKALSELETSTMSPGIKEFVAGQLRNEDPLDQFVKNYETLKSTDARKLLDIAGRASRILGKMLDDIAGQYNVKNPILSWVTRLMRVFWGLVEVSLPDSAANIVARHLLNLLYLFEVLLIVGGLLFSNDAIQQFGLVTLGITLAANVLILLLEDVAKQRKLKDPSTYRNPVARSIRVALVIAAVVCALSGLVLLAALLGVDSMWTAIDGAHSLIGRVRQAIP